MPGKTKSAADLKAEIKKAKSRRRAACDKRKKVFPPSKTSFHQEQVRRSFSHLYAARNAAGEIKAAIKVVKRLAAKRKKPDPAMRNLALADYRTAARVLECALRDANAKVKEAEKAEKKAQSARDGFWKAGKAATREIHAIDREVAQLQDQLARKREKATAKRKPAAGKAPAKKAVKKKAPAKRKPAKKVVKKKAPAKRKR